MLQAVRIVQRNFAHKKVGTGHKMFQHLRMGSHLETIWSNCCNNEDTEEMLEKLLKFEIIVHGGTKYYPIHGRSQFPAHSTVESSTSIQGEHCEGVSFNLFKGNKKKDQFLKSKNQVITKKKTEKKNRKQFL